MVEAIQIVLALSKTTLCQVDASMLEKIVLRKIISVTSIIKMKTCKTLNL